MPRVELGSGKKTIKTSTYLVPALSIAKSWKQDKPDFTIPL